MPEPIYLSVEGGSSVFDTLGPKSVVLETNSQGSIVLFRSLEGEEGGWVYPNTKLHYRADALQKVFPDLKEDQFKLLKETKSPDGTGVEPVRVEMLDHSHWRVADGRNGGAAADAGGRAEDAEANSAADAAVHAPERTPQERFVSSPGIKRAHVASVVIIVIALSFASWRLWPRHGIVDSLPPPTPEPTASPSPDAPQEKDGMVFVPGGTFKMGRDDGDEYERSAHEVPVARDASRPPQGPRATPAPTHTPRVPRRGRSADGPRRAAPRFVIVTIVSNLPGCEVAIDDELEERETDERGRLAIPMEPGLYDVRITKSGYVTDGREIEVKSSPSGYHQEESFTLRRALLNLKVNTNPTGVRVSLDGEPEVESDANGSLTFEKVDPSVRHTLRGAKENYAEETVEVPPYKMEATVRLNRDLLTLKVKTYPSQADVYLDDVLKGTSDADGVLSIEKVKVGREHSLRAIKAGYVTQSVPVPPDYELAVIKLPSATDSSTPAAVQPTPEAQSDQSGSRQSPDNKEAGRAAGTSPPDPDAARQGNITPPPATEATPVLGPLTGAQDRASVSPLDVELKFWDSIKDRDNPDELAVYIKKYPDGQFIDLARIRLKAALAKKEAETGSGAAPPAPTPEEPKPVLGDAAMTIRASADGKFLLVELTGKSGDASATTGVVEVTVTMKGDTQLVSGKLPGYPCRVALARLENVAEYAFGEVPGAGNQWGHVVVRVRPKDPKRSMHFLINWTALDSGQAGNTLGVVDSADGGATAATTSTPALTLRKVTPRYPTSARLSRAEGVVTVALEINERGDVVSAKATNGPASLREAAEDAARQWKFAPARQNNRPVKSTLSVQFSFRL